MTKSTRAPKRAAAERRRLILEGAHEVFAASGFARSSATRVARAAGVSAPALYRYFPSKKDLYVSTLEAAGPRLLEIWRDVADAASDPLEALWAVGLGYYDHVKSHSPVVRMWFQALCEDDAPEVRRAATANFVAAVDFLEKLLRSGRRRGLVRRDVDARVAAWQFMGIGLCFDLIQMLGRGAELDRRKVEAWGRLYLDSIRETSGETERHRGRGAARGALRVRKPGRQDLR